MAEAILDDFVKSPTSALRFISLSLRRTISTHHDTRFARLEFGTFYKAVCKSTFYEPIILRVKQWGNSLGVRLPMAVASEAHIRLDQQVRIRVEDGQVVITPIIVIPMTLEQRLERFDSARHGGEVMLTKPIGSER